MNPLTSVMSDTVIIDGSRSPSPDDVHTRRNEALPDPVIQFEAALMMEPDFIAQQAPCAITQFYRWVHNLITLLFNYAAHYFGTHKDHLQALEARIRILEARPVVPQVAAQPTPLPQQPQHPSTSTSKTRCQRCHVIGHSTTECRTKDPIATKKRVANNQKIKKELERQRSLPNPVYPRYYGPTRFDINLDDYFGDHVVQPPPPPPLKRQGMTTRSMTALVADASEFRRRKTQSVRDKRRKGATPSGTS